MRTIVFGLGLVTFAACASHQKSVRLVVLPDGGVDAVSENVTQIHRQTLPDGGTTIDVITE